MMKPLALAAAILAFSGYAVAAADSKRGWINIDRSDGWVSVQRNGEPMVTGSGRVAVSRRATGGFDAVHVLGPTRLEMKVGPVPSIEIAADDNLTDMITSRVQQGELKIDTRGSFRTRTVPVVRVTTPRLVRVRLQGSGDGRIEDVVGGDLELISQGSGNLIVTGRASRLSAKLYGSGDADLTRVASPAVQVAIYGSGNARVHAPQTLSAAVYGSGTIAYSGRPAQLQRSVHGSGSIDPVAR